MDTDPGLETDNLLPTTKLLKIPLLTDADRQALLTEPNHGINSRYDESQIEELLRLGGHWNYASTFIPAPMNVRREYSCFQRLQVVNPELVSSLDQRIGGASSSQEVYDEFMRGNSTLKTDILEALKQQLSLIDDADQIPDGRGGWEAVDGEYLTR